jgi:hypothetical protein
MSGGNVFANGVIQRHIMYRVHDGGIYVGWSWFATFANYTASLPRGERRVQKCAPRLKLAGRMVSESFKKSFILEIVRYVQAMKPKVSYLFPDVLLVLTTFLLITALQINFLPRQADSGNNAF